IGASLSLEGGPPELRLQLHADPGAVLDGVSLMTETAFEPSAVTIRLPSSPEVSIPPSLDRPEFGAGPGDSLWRAPQNLLDANAAGSPWLGMAADETVASEWIGDIEYTLVSVQSPVPSEVFSMWQALGGGDLRFYFSTADGVSTFDENTVGLRDPEHAHFNWGFTAEGIWQVTLQASGEHVEYGVLTDTETFTFSVGKIAAAVPEPSAAGWFGLALVVHLLRRKR
ncbi:MAG: choice-of-anchor M domain-containing protein, partial [Opitutales bacterium]